MREFWKQYPLPYKIITIVVMCYGFWTAVDYVISKPEGKEQQFTEVIVNNKPFEIVKEWRK